MSVDMQLEKHAQEVLDELARFGPLALAEVEPRIARELPSPADAVASLAAKKSAAGVLSESAPPAPKIEHRVVPGPGGDLLVRIYTPNGAGPFPVVVYFHGGGWVIANLNVYDSSARGICVGANCIVVSVAYRQAPENKFPAAVDDAYAATQWVFQNAESLNGDPARIAIAGESAGGNLATVTCLVAKEKGGAMPIHQLLVYPVMDAAMNTPSYREAKDYKPLNSASMAWFWKHYLANAAQGKDWRASPLLAMDLAGLPPATIITAELDPLRDEGEAYAAKLKAAGIPTTLTRYAAMPHEFFGMAAVVPDAKRAVAEATTALSSAFQKARAKPAAMVR